MIRIGRVVAGLGAAFVAVLLPMAAAAGAEVSGPCRGTIKGVDVATRSSSKVSDAIPVKKDERIAVGASAAGTIDQYKIKLHYAGIAWTVAKGDAKSNSWSKSVNVKPYARYGVGLYKVSGVSTGGARCTGAALVKVEGSALKTPAGILGAGLSIVGIGGVASICTKGVRPSRKLIQPSFRSDAINVQQMDPSTLQRAIDVDIGYVRTPQEYVNTVVHICGNAYTEPRVVTALIHSVCEVNESVVSSVCRWG